MTDEMTVQAQRPSALPYVLGGAALGGIAGGGAAAANVGIKAPAYSSWEEAIADVNKDDSFVKKQVEKGGDNKANWEAIQTQAKAVQDAEKAVTDIKMPEGFEAKAELDAVIEKEIALENAKKAVENKEKAAFETELANLKKLALPEGYEYNGTKYSEADFRKLLNSTEEADKAIVENLVKDSQGYKEAIGKADFAKTEKEALTAAEKALQDAEEALTKKDTKGLAGGVRDAYSNAKKGLTSAKNTAKEKLTEDLLGKCKKASTWKTAAVGATVLALAGLMIRPKGEEV